MKPVSLAGNEVKRPNIHCTDLFTCDKCQKKGPHPLSPGSTAVKGIQPSVKVSIVYK